MAAKHQIDVDGQSLRCQRDRIQGPSPHVCFDTHAPENADPGAPFHQLFDEVDVSGLQQDVWGKALFAEALQNQVSGT